MLQSPPKVGITNLLSFVVAYYVKLLVSLGFVGVGHSITTLCILLLVTSYTLLPVVPPTLKVI